ncbi:MAG TPA: universal stress protein [Geminicoccaceae bacterium]|nr:universal stress protein [Geminicoccaceae bacterium]
MRVILVPLGGEAYDPVALAAAYQIAQPFRAHITGLFIRPDPVEAVGAFQGIPPEIVDRVTRAAKGVWDERARLAKEAFDAARGAADAPFADRPTGTDTVTARWLECVGADDELLAKHGRLADLIVLAWLRADTPSGQLKERFATALFNTARPILLVPETGIKASVREIVVAWNGSAESTRALSGAMPLLLNAEQVHVLSAATPRTAAESGTALAEYLGWHGLICEAHPMYPKGEVGPALLARAKELGAELLVMGGYGRSRMRERIFGGVTRHVLDHCDLPVLIAH